MSSLGPEPGLGAETVDVEAPPGYTPPPSPAYAPPPEAPPKPSRPPTTPEAPSPPADVPAPAADASGRRGWQLLIVGLACVVLAAAVALAAVVSGSGETTHAFGEVATATTGAAVHTGGADAEARPLEAGEPVVAGWVVDTPEGGTVAIDLADGGALRFDAGARVAFVDLAVDPGTGQRSGESQPAVQVSGGRVWLNPASARAADAFGLQFPDAVVTSTGNPVAVDCTATCTVEAPAGGVTVTTGEDTEVAPAANEVVTLAAAGSFDLDVGSEPSAWAQQNLDADGTDGLPAPRPDDAPGIVDSAVLDGTYSLALEVVGPPAGDTIPVALQYTQGETYTLELTADGSGCTPGPCSVPITAADGASGTAQVRDGGVALTFGQPIDCYDEAYVSVVVPGIGTTTVAATLDIADVAFDGERWLVRTFEGAGTVAATLTTPCNDGDILGTSASPITVAGS